MPVQCIGSMEQREIKPDMQCGHQRRGDAMFYERMHTSFHLSIGGKQFRNAEACGSSFKDTEAVCQQESGCGSGVWELFEGAGFSGTAQAVSLNSLSLSGSCA